MSRFSTARVVPRDPQRMRDEIKGPEQSLFLRPEHHEKQAASGPPAFRKQTRQFHYRHRTRRVVVRAREHAAVLGSQMIVVRGDKNSLVAQFGIGAFKNPAAFADSPLRTSAAIENSISVPATAVEAERAPSSMARCKSDGDQPVARSNSAAVRPVTKIIGIVSLS